MTTQTLALLAASSAAFLGGVYLHDKLQTKHTLLRNYPLVGRLRYLSESAGHYLRPWLFSNDREELPFNRQQRSWVYASAKKETNLVSFGAQSVPDWTIGHSAFPPLAEEEHTGAIRPPEGFTLGVETGPGACRTPFPVESLFNISGMSYGALSHTAVSALSRGAAMAGLYMSTGEGGLSPYHLEGGCNIIAQIGTAKYGYRDEHGRLDEVRLAEIASLPQVRAIELKLSQGAKPGKGGILPAGKVTPEIAEIRGIPVGQDSISPNRHPEIGNIQELGEMIARLRAISGLPVGLKMALGQTNFLVPWFEHAAEHPAYIPDYIQLDGGLGGTGAAPPAYAERVGLLLADALPLLVAARDRAGLRHRVHIIASERLITPDKIAWALCMGASGVASARGFLFSLGCIMASQCGSGNCPTGITASNPRLIKGLDPTDKSVRVANYAETVRQTLEDLAHSCGLSNARAFTGRTDLIARVSALANSGTITPAAR